MGNTAEMISHTEFLTNMAKKYIWWETLEEAMTHPRRILVQVMDIGVWDDLCVLVDLFSSRELLEALLNSEAGQFRPRSWHFWCYRLIGRVPPMPERKYK